MSLSKEKRHRKRVPVSCLNCKKRKVKCDKLRPCSGCVKNNVGHLCVYVEPVWAENLAKIASEVPVNAQETAVDKPLSLDMETTIAKQANELKCLRAQLAHFRSQPQSQPDIQAVASVDEQRRSLSASNGTLESQAMVIVSTQLQLGQTLEKNHTAMSVLGKINPTRKHSNVPVLVVDDIFEMKNFGVSGQGDKKKPTPSPLELYSWLNIIRLDPQLTALWYKITNLQKSYHLYKQSLRKQGTDNTLSATANDDASNCSHQTCPVVACEFNTMLEESNISIPRESSSSVSPPSSDSTSRLRLEDEDAVDMLTLLQKLWSKVKTKITPLQPLNYTQLCFLVQFYFDRLDSGAHKQILLNSEIDSKILLRSFETQIMSLFECSGDDIRLNVGVFASDMSDDDMMKTLRMKAIYMSMLRIIVEEAVTSLRSQCLVSSEAINLLSTIFPSDFFSSPQENSIVTALSDIVELLRRVSEARVCKKELNSLLSYVALLVATLNCLLQHYNKNDLQLEIFESFTHVFEILIDIIVSDDKLQLWCDPTQIVFEAEDDDKSKVLELRVLFCQLWSDIVRLINHTVMNFIPVLKHSKRLERQVYTVLEIIVLAERENTHARFLSSIMSENSRNIVNTLKVGYLISRTLFTLLNGVYGNPAMSQVTISKVFTLVSEISIKGDDISLTMLPLIKYFEIRLMLHYLELFLITITTHQAEELGDSNLVTKIIPALFSKCLDINKFLQGSCVQFTKTANSLCVLAMIAEALGRMSHLIAGLLIRFRTETQTNKGCPVTHPDTNDVLVYGPKLSAQSRFTIPVETKNNIIGETDKTMYLLETNAPIDCVLKKTKIWKFYSTFIRNSHKMNSESYAKLHAEAFKSGKLLSVCPVMPSSKYPVSATRTEVSGCPVAHGEMLGGLDSRNSRATTPSLSNILRPNQPGITKGSFCPVTHADSNSIQTSMSSRTNLTPGSGPMNHRTKIRKLSSRSSFAFETETPTNETSLASEDRAASNPKAQQLRLENVITSDLGFPNTSPRFTPPLFPYASASLAQSQSIGMPMSPSSMTPKQELQADIIDWDSLPNFNFDFMSDESLMLQVNSGDINSLLSEGVFL